MSATSFVGVTAFASSVQVDANGLNFNSGALAGSSAVTQADEDNSNNLGEDFAVGDEFHYYNVFTAGGTQVDARISMVSESGIASSSNVDGLLDKLDDASAVAGTNAFLQTELDLNEQTGESFVELKIEFLTGLTTTADSGTPVTLTNLQLTVMDVDHYQYAQFQNVDSYTFADSSILIAQPLDSGYTRFVETNGVGTSSSDADYEKSRVSLKLGDISQMTFKLGQNVLSGSESAANFDLDFSAGGAWTLPQVEQAAPSVGVAPYSGPIPKSYSSCVPSSGGKVTLRGSNLASVNSVEVLGNQVSFSVSSQAEMILDVPALQTGRYDVTYRSSSATIVHWNSLEVCDIESPTDNAGLSRYYVVKRFSAYQGDDGTVVESDKLDIQSFIESNPGLERVTCLGSTSGVPALPTDAELAESRASNACAIVKDLLPEVATKTAYVTGRGVGQFHRAVVLYGVGAR